MPTRKAAHHVSGQKLQVGCLTLTTNATVIQLPTRKFPGVVIQGDSLSILVRHAEQVADGLKEGRTADATEHADELVQLLKGYQAIYEAALQREGIELPYVR